MWEDRKKQELKEAAIAVPPQVYDRHLADHKYRNHVKIKGELF